jgi:hypothetical protein
MRDDSEKLPRATSSRAHAVVEKDDQIGSRRAVDVGRVLKTLPVRFGARNMTRQCDPEIFMESRRAFSLKKLSGDTRDGMRGTRVFLPGRRRVHRCSTYSGRKNKNADAMRRRSLPSRFRVRVLTRTRGRERRD